MTQKVGCPACQATGWYFSMEEAKQAWGRHIQWMTSEPAEYLRSRLPSNLRNDYRSPSLHYIRNAVGEQVLVLRRIPEFRPPLLPHERCRECWGSGLVSFDDYLR